MNQQGNATRWQAFPRIAFVALGLAIVSGVASFIATGPTLGLFFGGMIFAALLVPPLCLAEESLVNRMIVAMAVNEGIAIVWLAAVLGGHITLTQWLICYVILAVWCFVLAAMACLIRRGFRNPIPAAAIAVIVAMLWLSLPIWLARPMPQHPALVDWLVPPHPLLALNGVLHDLGTWTERPIAYQSLVTLGQDVPYQLPRTIAPFVAVHLLIGLVALAGWAAGRR